MAKPKRSTKQNPSVLFKVRSYGSALDVVKIQNHDRLYLVGDTLVVYLAASPASPSETREAGRSSYLDAGDNQRGLSYGQEGIPNPEQVHGYTFSAKVVAMGSLVDGRIGYLTDSDTHRCADLGIYTSMAGKLQRSHAAGERKSKDEEELKKKHQLQLQQQKKLEGDQGIEQEREYEEYEEDEGQKMEVDDIEDSPSVTSSGLSDATDGTRPPSGDAPMPKRQAADGSEASGK